MKGIVRPVESGEGAPARVAPRVAPRVVFTVPDFVQDGVRYTDIEVTFESDTLIDASRLVATLNK